MDQDLQVDEEYKRSFNEGYILAKELGMNKDSIKDIAAGNQRMVALREGIEQYEKDALMQKERDKLFADMDKRERDLTDKDPSPEKDKSRDKGDFEMNR